MLVGRSVARMPGIVSGGCGRAGVEEIVGFAGPWGRRGVVWVCFWVPGPPPATWSRAVFRMPLAGRRRPVGRGSGPVGVRGGLRTG